jgi:hypothetical protein
MQSLAHMDSSMIEAPARASSRGSRIGLALVAVAIFASTVPPALLWFNADHANSAAWHEHARFHIVWNACLLLALSALALAALAAYWDREPRLRLALTIFPIAIALTYFFAGLVLAPGMGITEPFRESTPLVFFGVDIKLGGWVVLMIAAAGGYLLDRRARLAGAR